MYFSLSLFILILVGPSNLLMADMPAESAYLDGGKSEIALVLAHGIELNPTSKVVDPLRKGVHRSLGYHTLSLQMPNKRTSWDAYGAYFPEAYATINEGVKFLKEEKGVTKIYLLGHSMGGRMISAYAAEYDDEAFMGLIVAGCFNNGPRVLSCKSSLKKVKLPVLDIWAGGDQRDRSAAQSRRGMISSTFKQVQISGANHSYAGYEDMLVKTVVNWLKSEINKDE